MTFDFHVITDTFILFEFCKVKHSDWNESTKIRILGLWYASTYSNRIRLFNPKQCGLSVKIVKKWLYYLLLKMFIDKVKNFCDHSMILWEMAANPKPTGHFWTPPASFRVNITKTPRVKNAKSHANVTIKWKFTWNLLAQTRLMCSLQNSQWDWIHSLVAFSF